MYSFTKPNKKPFFAEDTKLWLIFISAVSGIMIFFSLFLLTKSYLYKQDIKDFTKTINNNQKEIITLKNKINFIKEEKILCTKIDVNNELL